MTTAQMLNVRAAYVAKEVALATAAAGLDPIHSGTAQRIAAGVIQNGGSVHSAIDAAKRYIAARVVRERLARYDKLESEREPVSEWVGWLVFGAAMLVVIYEAAAVAGMLP